MSIKIVVFDVDGTLYDTESHSIPESCIEAIQKLKANHIRFVIATGRAHYGLGKALNELHADYILSANGGVVFDNRYKKVLSHTDISLEECSSLITFCKRENAGLVFKFLDHMYIYQHPEKIDWLEGQINSDIGTDPFIFHPEQNHHLIDLPQCASVHADSVDIEQYSKTSSLSFTQYSEDGFDVAPKNVNKGRGLRTLLNMLDISKEEVACFGDNYNDTEMMMNSGTRIAMGNAVPEIKQIADHTTDSVDQNGIYNGLKWLSLI